MFSACRLELPITQCKFSFSDDQSRYNLGSKHTFKVVYMRTTKNQHSISVYGVKLFNSLPNSIASLQNFDVFKKQLKNYILEQYNLKVLY